MSKSDDAKPARVPVPIKRIQMRGGETMDVPGKKGAHSLVSGGKHRISYEPWTKRIVITYREADHKPPEVLHVPDAWVAYEVA